MMYLIAALFGLLIGSFLSVVISRLPLMLNTQWAAQCREFLNQPEQKTPRFNLALPRSHCPKCKTLICWWQNIPLLSYVILRGRCAHCQIPIPVFYPLLEISTAILSIWVVSHFGLNWQMVCALIFTYALITMTCIDWQTQLLPDELTLGLLWIGLLISTRAVFVSPEEAIIGAFIGYAVLWLLAQIYTLLRKQEGMGYGDLKLLAALGAWTGILNLLNILLISSLLGLIVGLLFLLRKKITSNQPLPFGPYLAIAGWLSLLYGPFVLAYFHIIQ